MTPYLEDDLFARRPDRRRADPVRLQLAEGEGAAQPLDFAKELSAFCEAETRLIVRKNVVELLASPPGQQSA